MDIHMTNEQQDQEIYEDYMSMTDDEKDVFMSVRLICKETYQNGGNMKEAIKTHSDITGVPVSVLKKRVDEQLIGVRQ